MNRIPLLAAVVLCCTARLARGDDLDQLAQDFWTWRAQNAPFSADDVNRMERPGGLRDWSGAAIEQRRTELAAFDARWKKLDSARWPVPRQVDYRLIGSALARVRWELEVNARWRRDPNFYLDQTLTALTEALTVPAPYDETRSREILDANRKHAGHFPAGRSESRPGASAVRNRRDSGARRHPRAAAEDGGGVAAGDDAERART